MSKVFFETCIKAQRNDISELTIFTMGDCVQAIMAIDSINSARSFYEGYVEWIIDNTGVESRSEAELVAESNIGFCYGEGMSPDRIAMWKEACSAEHPLFGATMPTPEEAFAEGVKRGSMAKLDEIRERVNSTDPDKPIVMPWERDDFNYLLAEVERYKAVVEAAYEWVRAICGDSVLLPKQAERKVIEELNALTDLKAEKEWKEAEHGLSSKQDN
jgi:hypothetical protein